MSILSCNAAFNPRIIFEGLEGRTLFAFGVTVGTAPTGQSTYVVDNGANVKFSVIAGGTVSNTLHLGDLSSIQYKSQELLATYAQTGRYSHYEQGLSSSTVVSYTVDTNKGWILVKCDDSTASAASAIQYYIVRKGDDNIYMASLPTDVNSGPGEGRFIAYLSRSVFSNPEAPSDNAGSTGAIEGGDVFGHPDGTTSSKFYNMGRRMIENVYHGLTGTAGGTSVGAWMYMGDREHSAGGPFFKDIDYQSGTDTVEMYNCLFTGHTQTEAYRQGLYTYALQLNGGATPVAPDYSWLENVTDASGNFLISGLIPAAQRGSLSGVASGVPTGHEVTVTLSNTTAQYWGTPDSAGKYTISGIQPGTYTETLFDGELESGTRTVTIAAGQKTGANIADTRYAAAATWRIGTWDGTPLGFLNSDKIETMHPSDVRMASWTSTPNFVIGTNTDAQFPLVQFMGVNNSQRITFNLTAAQAAVQQTLRIGITEGFSGARNRPVVNAGQSYAYTFAIPSPTTDLNSRGITRGTWRGPNQLYTFTIPTSALKAGTNTIDLGLVSGSYIAGQTWLSPNVVYDALDLVPTASLTNAPVASTIAINPSGNVPTSWQKTFSAIVKDQFGNVTPANLVWGATRGTIDDTGLYIAPATAGSDTVTATYNGITASYTFNVTDPPPTIATAAVANPSPVNATTTALSVLGADNGGESNLTYTWAIAGTPPAPVTFSANGTNAAKNTVATFTKAGTYSFVVTVTDALGSTTTSTVSTTVGFGAFTDSVDVGAPALAGSLSFNSSTGAYTVKAGGADVWAKADQIRYNYSTLAGDGAVIARITSTTNSNARAKAGVMFRDSTATNAAYAFLFVNPSGAVLFETRASNGVSSVYSATATSTLPTWLKLIRSGSTFAAYYSTTGTSWTKVGTTQIVTMATTAPVGLAVCSHNVAVLNTTVFDNVSINLPPTLTSVSSRKTQGTAGTFDLPIALNATSPTVESRAGGASTLVFTFSEAVIAADGLLDASEFTIGNAAFTSATVSGVQLTLQLKNVVDQARTTVTLKGLTDSAGNTITGTSAVTVRSLYGDVNGNGLVNSTDIALVKAASGQAASSIYYLLDLNASGLVNSTDIALVKSLSGHNVA